MQIPFDELECKILEVTDDLSKFDCSQKDPLQINEFLHNEALKFQKERLGLTYLFFFHRKIIGFVTLSMSQIEVKNIDEEPPFPLNIKYYPALLIGRLGVDNNYRLCGVGTNICLWCLSLAKNFSTQIGCRFIIVYTSKEISHYYRKNNFIIASKDKTKQKFFMYNQIPLV